MALENVFKALGEFPPKLSDLLTPVEDIENKIEGAISSATGISLPPGPVKVVKNLMGSIEGSMATLMRAKPIGFVSPRTVPVKVEVVSTPSLGQAQVAEVRTTSKPLRSEFEAFEV